MKKIVFLSLLSGILLNFSFIAESNANQNMVNVYSFRQVKLIEPLIKVFTEQTGIKVNVVSGKADKLMQRLIQDGDDSFADVLLTVGAARLDKAKRLNLIKPISSAILLANVPENLRDPENYWFALSLRVRAIFYAKDKINPQLLTSYESLLNKRWLGKICSRAGNHFYNRAMVASFIYHYGDDWTKNWVQNFSDNLAMRPNGNDRDQMRKVARGDCDIAIANSYYYGMLSNSIKQSDRETYQKIGIILPQSRDIGSHVNISGAALTHSAKNVDNAIKFIEFLTTKKAQKIYAHSNFEFPVHADIPAGEFITSWGELNADTQPILHLPLYHKQAAEIISQSNW
ncbi:MAG: extracellular solute-binding protein [Colwellia sp.]|uniref:extracellular solute-binding protein n=1 Tax=Colwellia sp. TaxID=56799 RepID=UPI001D46BBB6|nr:extracellular solute-binding protein [Colwellia sp.]NQY48884.1 extracellular solute-binding protein [Colwellia sp.]